MGDWLWHYWEECWRRRTADYSGEVGGLILKSQEGYVQLAMRVTTVGKSAYPAGRKSLYSEV